MFKMIAFGFAVSFFMIVLCGVLDFSLIGFIAGQANILTDAAIFFIFGFIAGAAFS